MTTDDVVRYEHRNIETWLKMAEEGRLALPEFQRSWTWSPQKTANYLLALLQTRPTGIMLILRSAEEPQFDSRMFSGMNRRPRQVTELVLDGQQRLTSLWHALLKFPDDSDYRFYIKVDDFQNRNLAVQEVEPVRQNTAKGKRLAIPQNAFSDNYLPTDILWDAEKDPEDLGKIWNWCHEAFGDGDAAPVSLLDKAINAQLREPLLFKTNLWYCSLPEQTTIDVAVDIFIETNSSSAPIKRFDIVVAIARGTYDESLRDRIRAAYNENEIFQYYFGRNEDDWIPDIGVWMLKVACLKAMKPPKESNYEYALESLAPTGTPQGLANLSSVFEDLKHALEFASRHGAPTIGTLPSWPPLHVLAALREATVQITDPARQGTAHRLLDAYYWRCLFTNRHEMQANDRVLEDYQQLLVCLREIAERGNPTRMPEVFRDAEYPLPEAGDLGKEVPWIGAKGRLGRAILTAVLSDSPPGWIIGNGLDAAKIRELEDSRALDRHHVFPMDFLKRSGINDKKRIQHGLNGVLLDSRTNRKFSKRDPNEYLNEILTEQNIGEQEIKRRVEAHLVPYDAMRADGNVEQRYNKFIRRRADLVVEKIKTLSRFD